MQAFTIISGWRTLKALATLAWPTPSVFKVWPTLLLSYEVESCGTTRRFLRRPGGTDGMISLPFEPSTFQLLNLLPITLSPQNRPSTTQYRCLVVNNARESAMLAPSGLCEGRAREVLSLHTAPISVPKTLATNSRISITSNLIETKRLQVALLS